MHDVLKSQMVVKLRASSTESTLRRSLCLLIQWKVTNTLKGLDMMVKSAYRTMDGGLWHCTGGSDQDHPQDKEMQNGKMVVWGGDEIAEQRREVKGKGEKDRYIYPSECRVSKNSKERQESLPQWSMKEIEENNRMGKTRDLFKKIRDTKGTFHAKMSTIEGGPNSGRRY